MFLAWAINNNTKPVVIPSYIHIYQRFITSREMGSVSNWHKSISCPKYRGFIQSKYAEKHLEGRYKDGWIIFSQVADYGIFTGAEGLGDGKNKIKEMAFLNDIQSPAIVR